ncbi:beta-glucosidase 18 [Nicotiana tomentosiformis]|uniref:beta-glucosidase 18 n=1 Tax=Nicotiana tomentosiformis TaxID=4098 RepID=UPI000877F892|nr:beta-glucosidase 18 [Nicotiana tomentosiformis]
MNFISSVIKQSCVIFFSNMAPAIFWHTWLAIICIFFSGFIVSCHETNNLILKENPNQVSSSSNFLFGTASSCYQYEGAFLSDGKGLNNWDLFTHEAGHIKDGSNGDVAVDHYNRYLEDVKLMADMGVNSYRFSISWARILPKGIFGDVNMAGIEHYNKLIDALLQKGIQPFVTLTHYDIPQELEDRYGGWLSSRIQDDFSYFADICFKYFGDRVKHWVTMNEPNLMADRGYRTGIYPPARCSGIFGNCSAGDSEREPFIAAHNMILSHAAAVSIYRTRYQKRQGGMVGISLDIQWYEPYSNSSEDIAATQRARSFYVNWFLDPIILGRYPKEMVQILGSNLPDFSVNDLRKLSYGLDFIGINYYTAKYIKDCLYSACEHGNTWSEGSYFVTTQKDGVDIGQPTEVDWLFLYPQGMKKIVIYMKDRFNNTPMVITENGIAENENLNPSITDTLNDVHRVNYMHSYLTSLANAIREGADVRGYFVWSLLDNFEWLDGYSLRFGLHYVNFTNLQRIPKLSATSYKGLMYNFHIQLETHTVQK